MFFGLPKLIRENLVQSSSKVVINEDLKLIYVPIAKNANSYIKSLFLCNSRDDFDPCQDTPLRYCKRKGIRMYQPAKRSKPFDDYEKVIVLRDPFGRFLSAFYDKVVKKYPQRIDYCRKLMRESCPGDVTFADFVDHIVCTPDWRRNHHFRSQSYYFQLFDNYDHIGRVEELSETVRWLSSRGMRIPEFNKLSMGVIKKTQYGKAYGFDPSLLSINELKSLKALPARDCYLGTKSHDKIMHSYKLDYDLLGSIGRSS